MSTPEPSNATLTEGDSRHSTPPGSSAHLYLVLDADHPTFGGARHSLDKVDAVTLGRGAAYGALRSQADGTSLLALSLADRHASSAHAKLMRVMGQWVLEDQGSKNGVRLNGQPLSQGATLVDGDVFEVGRTYFLFRAAQPRVEPRDVRSHGEGPGAPETLSPTLAAQTALLAKVATSQVSVLLQGETGTGKEVAARALHRRSGRGGPFVAVNCGAIPPNLVEAELFGHQKGAFSGATEARPGHFRSAERGTLFLDEVGDLPLAFQPAFLRALQEREVTPVGASRPIPVDVRVVSATHHDLSAMAARGAFRADLLARLQGLTFTLPALCDRREDLGLLVAELLARLAMDRAPRLRLSLAAARALTSYAFPANIRELEKCLERALALALDDTLDDVGISAEALPASAERDGDDSQLRERLVGALTRNAGNVSAVARELGKARMQIQRWLKRFELEPDAFKK